jgi:predicted DNA-binding transcriptional regulator AlpA
MQTNSALLTERQLAGEWGLSHRTLQAWRVRGDGPTYVKVGRSVRYSKAQADAWLAQRQAANTAVELPPMPRPKPKATPAGVAQR